jgi:hypothetical protein
MKAFDKNTSMGAAFDKNTSMGAAFDKNTSMGIVAAVSELSVEPGKSNIAGESAEASASNEAGETTDN